MPVRVPDHAASEIAIGSRPGVDTTKKNPGEVFEPSWRPLIKMDESVRAKVGKPVQSLHVEAKTD